MASHRKESNLKRVLARSAAATAVTAVGLSIFAGTASAGGVVHRPAPPPPAEPECASNNDSGLVGVNVCHADTDVSDVIEAVMGTTAGGTS